jgi:hypothetical protein
MAYCCIQQKAIQTTERNFDCFATACKGVCDQAGCSSREDCFDAARSGKLSIINGLLSVLGKKS